MHSLDILGSTLCASATIPFIESPHYYFIVFGFDQTTMTGVERGEPYSISIGYLSGGTDVHLELDIEVTLGTASKKFLSLKGV